MAVAAPGYGGFAPMAPAARLAGLDMHPPIALMDTNPAGRSTGREIVERLAEAALGPVPLAGAAPGVTFVTVLGWRLGQRREKWFTQLAGGVGELRERAENLDLKSLADSDPFVNAVMTATRTAEHTHQEEKNEVTITPAHSMVASPAITALTGSLGTQNTQIWTALILTEPK
jgi:hypothetical protein